MFLADWSPEFLIISILNGMQTCGVKLRKIDRLKTARYLYEFTIEQLLALDYEPMTYFILFQTYQSAGVTERYLESHQTAKTFFELSLEMLSNLGKDDWEEFVCDKINEKRSWESMKAMVLCRLAWKM